MIDKDTGKERLWTADPAVWNRHAPILFPFVGRVTEGKYRIGGREYQMKTQHGFARDMDFCCVEETASSVTHRLAATDATKEIYPYDFRLQVKHFLDPDHAELLHIEWDIENAGETAMTYAIGGHPGFQMPAGINKEDCFLVFPGKERLAYFQANKEGFALPDQVQDIRVDLGNTAAITFREMKITTISNAASDFEALAKTDLKDALFRDDTYSATVYTKDKGGVLCVPLLYSENWKAYVNGSKADLMNINGGMLGVTLEKGENRVMIRYAVPYFKVGMYVSLAALVGVLVLCVVPFGRKKER